ncbi:hypothetical protein ABGV49_03920 [Chromobacterium vaccinii]|uniref:DUF3185 domain-containing protein n=1 Tax=Chromobacterium vaccinii TaxID=1108595 RepID=A0ABV0F8B6_9NEIS
MSKSEWFGAAGCLALLAIALGLWGLLQTGLGVVSSVGRAPEWPLTAAKILAGVAGLLALGGVFSGRGK